MKCYVVTRNPIYVDGYDSQIVVFLDENKAKGYVEYHNVPYDNVINQAKVCETCHTYDDEKECFKLEHKCDLASVKEDRNGLYCENEKSQYDSGIDYYSYEEVEFVN